MRGREKTGKYIGFLVLALWIVGASLTQGFGSFGMKSVSVCTLCLIWAFGVQRRILSRKLRISLVVIAGLMIFLFLLQVARYSVFTGDVMGRRLWYAYYIPLTMIPLVSLLAALITMECRERTLLCVAAAGLCVCVLFGAGFLTNDIHMQAFVLNIHSFGGENEYARGWLYYAAVVWIVLLMLLSALAVVRGCMLSSRRRYFYVPLLVLSLYGVYEIVGYMGDFFHWRGKQILSFHDVFCIVILGFWESCIQIGLVSSNSEYGEIFERSSVRAQIADDGGEVVYRSGEDGMFDEERRGDLRVGEDIRLHSRAISGGYVYWVDDISALNQMRRELADRTRALAEENDLLRTENELIAKQTRIATQNRLYDDITDRARPVLKKLQGLLPGAEHTEEEYDRRLAASIVLCAYIKRRSNLSIIAEHEPVIPLEELFLSIRESMEYLRLAGVVCDVTLEETGGLPTEQIFAAYDYYERVVERLLDAFLEEGAVQATLAVRLSAGGDFPMLMDLETSALEASCFAEIDGEADLSEEEGTILLKWTGSGKKGGEAL